MFTESNQYQKLSFSKTFQYNSILIFRIILSSILEQQGKQLYKRLKSDDLHGHRKQQKANPSIRNFKYSKRVLHPPFNLSNLESHLLQH